MTISVYDWINGATVAPGIFERWPDYRLMLVAAEWIDTTALAGVAERLHDEAHQAVRAIGSGEPDAHTVRWQAAYRDFGVKPRVARPSVDALVRRAASEKGLPKINVLVDLYNAISILNRVPIGGEDLDYYEGPSRLILASGDEPFQTAADGAETTEHPDTGEPVWIDSAGITCRRWNWRQTTRTAIRFDTVRAGFIIDSLDAPEHHGADLAASQLVALLPAARIRTIDITNR
jgi:DNA/RNA-binding domain of Phe-tRNA-synthetase-like protein